MTRGMTGSCRLVVLTLATICSPCLAEAQQRPGTADIISGRLLWQGR